MRVLIERVRVQALALLSLQEAGARHRMQGQEPFGYFELDRHSGFAKVTRPYREFWVHIRCCGHGHWRFRSYSESL